MCTTVTDRSVSDKKGHRKGYDAGYGVGSGGSGGKTCRRLRILLRFLRDGGLFLVLAAITAHVILKEYSLAELLSACSQADPVYLIAAIAMMLLFFLCEGINLGRGLQLAGCRTDAGSCRAGKGRLLFYALTGFFFSSVTPSASGGQPMQLYYMHRDGIRTPQAILALLLELASFQTAAMALAGIGAVLFFFYGPSASAFMGAASGSMGAASAFGGFFWLFLAGVLLNLLVLFLLLMLLFSGRAARILLAAAFWLQRQVEGRLPSKDAAADAADASCRRRLLGSAAAWRRAASALRKNPRAAASLLATSGVQLCGFCAVPWLVCRSLGLSHLRLPLTMGTQAMLYVSVSSLPLPGAAGVTEGGFSVLFSEMIPPHLLGCALILSRLVSFYLPLVLSGLGFLIMKKRPDIFR